MVLLASSFRVQAESSTEEFRLKAARAQVAELEHTIAEDRERDLAGLPAQYGFESVQAFVRAVQDASGGRRGRKPGTAKAARPGKRRRAKITDEVRKRVIVMVNAGQPGSKIAAAVGISLPSVQNIKKAAGLVTARADKADKPKLRTRKPARKAASRKPAAAPAEAAPKAE